MRRCRHTHRPSGHANAPCLSRAIAPHPRRIPYTHAIPQPPTPASAEQFLGRPPPARYNHCTIMYFEIALGIILSYLAQAFHSPGLIRWASLVLIPLLLLAAPAAKADCILFRHSTGGAEYIDRQGRNFFGSRFPLYADANCQTRHPTHDSGWYLGGVAYASSARSARSICAANHSASISHVSPVGNRFWRCATGDGAGAQGGGSPGAGQSETASDSCSVAAGLSLDGLKLRATDGLGSGIQFRRLNACGIGIQSVIDMGLLDAVDVWANVGSGYQVCFPGRGRILLLDAATAPRSVVHVDYQLRGWIYLRQPGPRRHPGPGCVG